MKILKKDLNCELIIRTIRYFSTKEIEFIDLHHFLFKKMC